MAIIDKPSDYFNPVIYTGNGGTQTISNVNFQPNFTWIKHRDGATAHMLFDSVRGALYRLQSNSTNTSTSAANTLTSWNSDGFVLGSENDTNGNSRLFVSWNWLTGTSFSNSSGSNGANLDSTGSLNTDAGFSIVSFTGQRDATRNIYHGLGSIPKIIIIKNTAVTQGWTVYSSAIAANERLVLNNTTAKGTCAACFANTRPTSSVFTVGDDADTNGTGNAMIAYCFAEKQSYSKFGTYTGNGSTDGPFVYTGFSPSFIMGKRTDGTGPWWMLDNKRDGYNVTNRYLLADDSRTEGTDVEYNTDFLSNGWKARYNNGNFNASGGSYIYMAFAENPFVTSTANGSIPATAR